MEMREKFIIEGRADKGDDDIVETEIKLRRSCGDKEEDIAID